jgi:hypothetical protein
MARRICAPLHVLALAGLGAAAIPGELNRYTLEAKAKNMSLASALTAVGHKLQDSDVSAFIQMGAQRRHHRMHHHNQKLRANSGSVADAVKKLNEMVTESEKKLDLEDIKCSQYIEEQEELMETVLQDISSFNAMAAAARAHILQAMTTIELIETKMPQMKSDLQANLEKCARDRAALKAQLTILEGDASVMGTILGLIDCPTTLLQCNAGIVKIPHRVLRSKLANVKSTSARRQIQALIDQASVSFNDQTTAAPTPAANASAPGTMNTTDDPDPRKAARKCSISGSPSCILLRDRFLDIQADMMNNIEQLEEEIGKMTTECKEQQENFEAQIKDFETRLKGSQTDLAEATETQNQAEEQSRLKSSQLTELEKDLRKEKTRCKAAITNLKNECCGLKRIRQELLKIKSQPLVVQDCEVSGWVKAECSATCGGGVEKLTRSITIPAVNGAACPPLSMEQKCNSKPCPIDCRVSGWSGWSSCSAKCGGGVKQRTRSVVVEAQHGGDPCGQTSITESCNIQSCDRNCKLSRWTKWSACSKACGGGFQTSIRRVRVPAKGQGRCPSWRSRWRRRFKRCNTNDCVAMMTGPTLKCESKLDVVIVLDGSGSLGSRGWKATQVMGKMLVDAFKDANAQVGVILFSGPTNSRTLRQCFMGTTTPENCGTTWVEHFQTGAAKISALATKVGALEWPAKTTMTSVALAAAENELRNGRSDAQSLVIVVTDGRPMSGRRTYQAARSLREKARLMWVPVGRNVPIRFLKQCASAPVRDNMVIVKDFNAMKEPKVINDIIADACPKCGR